MGFGIAGFVIAILSVLAAGVIGHLVGLPLSIVGCVKTRRREVIEDNKVVEVIKQRGWGLSIAGLVVNIVGILAVIAALLRQVG